MVTGVVGRLCQGGRVAIEFQVTFDSADPAAHAAFWAEALHYVPPPSGLDQSNNWAVLVDPDGAGPRLYFQRVPEPKTAKNRVHLDLRSVAGVPAERRADMRETECTRLVALGATRVRRLEADGVNDVCIVMQDPEGNEFCLD